MLSIAIAKSRKNASGIISGHFVSVRRSNNLRRASKASNWRCGGGIEKICRVKKGVREGGEEGENESALDDAFGIRGIT